MEESTGWNQCVGIAGGGETVRKTAEGIRDAINKLSAVHEHLTPGKELTATQSVEVFNLVNDSIRCLFRATDGLVESAQNKEGIGG